VHLSDRACCVGADGHINDLPNPATIRDIATFDDRSTTPSRQALFVNGRRV